MQGKRDQSAAGGGGGKGRHRREAADRAVAAGGPALLSSHIRAMSESYPSRLGHKGRREVAEGANCDVAAVGVGGTGPRFGSGIGKRERAW